VPTRKQRRRRQKGRRHEYEYVYVDDEGNEVAVAPDELPAERRTSRNGRARQKARATSRPAIPPPSWRRVGKRGLIFAPLMFITVMLLDDKDLGWVAWLSQTALLLGVFLPFSYFVDTFMYRRYLRRTGEDPDAAKRA
jgi:hypothetical protein